jgi:flagellar protein FlbD
MIKMTRIDKSEFTANADMIEFVEATPDTIVTLISGKKIVVVEPVEIVVHRIVEYKKACNMPLVTGDQ